MASRAKQWRTLRELEAWLDPPMLWLRRRARVMSCRTCRDAASIAWASGSPCSASVMSCRGRHTGRFEKYPSKDCRRDDATKHVRYPPGTAGTVVLPQCHGLTVLAGYLLVPGLASRAGQQQGVATDREDR